MDLLATSINAAVVAVAGLLLWWFGRGRFDALDDRIDGLEEHLVGTGTRLDDRIDRLEVRLDGRFDRLEGGLGTLQSSMDAMRSDLTQVALAVGVRPRAQND
jgi:hypothetical protein